MKEGVILVKPRDITRHQVIERCNLGLLTNEQAARLIKISVRQLQRLKPRVKKYGLAGVIHQNRGRPPANKLPESTSKKIEQLILKPWYGLNCLHVRDKLIEEKGIKVSRETIRRLYHKHKLPLRRHKRKRRFTRRERKPQEGMLLQIDGSLHDWFSTGKKAVLIAAIDDANNEIPWASFCEAETSINYLKVLKQIVERKGVFCSAYVDGASCFRTVRRDWGNHKTFRKEDYDETQVRWALGELGIEVINAHTPQAKGRIERLFQLLQDRLLKELSIRNIKNIEEGNKFLHNQWLTYYNKKFIKEPASKDSCYLKLPKNIDLEEIFCLKYNRQVNNDNTINFKGNIYEILPDKYRISYAKANIEVRVYLDKDIRLFYKERPLLFKKLSC